MKKLLALLLCLTLMLALMAGCAGESTVKRARKGRIAAFSSPLPKAAKLVSKWSIELF